MTNADNTIYHIFDKAIHILETKRDPLCQHVVSVKLIIKRLTMDKIARRNINNLRYADDTTLIAEK